MILIMIWFLTHVSNPQSFYDTFLMQILYSTFSSRLGDLIEDVNTGNTLGPSPAFPPPTQPTLPSIQGNMGAHL